MAMGHGCSTGTWALLKHAGICQAALAEFHTAGKTAVEMDMLPLIIDFVPDSSFFTARDGISVGWRLSLNESYESDYGSIVT